MRLPINILLITNDKALHSYLTDRLTGNGYLITSASTGAEGLRLTVLTNPDIILLTPLLPDMRGVDILCSLRGWNQSPVIILSSHAGEADKVRFLDAGADDYLTFPFGIAELMARIRTCLRRSHILNTCKTYKALELEIQFEKRLIQLSGKRIHLTQVEYRLLTLLAENSGHVLTYDFLIKALWGPYLNCDNKILRVNMTNIRRKIEKEPGNPQYVFTENGIGYRMRENETA